MKRKTKRQLPDQVGSELDVFKEFLLQNFKYGDTLDTAFKFWAVRCEMIPDIAAKWLVAYRRIIQNPPSDLEAILVEYGDIPFSAPESTNSSKDSFDAVEWATETYRLFSTYFFEHTDYGNA